MRIGGIIFSRMNSRRLPRKAFANINGKTLLERVVESTKKIKSLDHFCIATSESREDDTIASFAEKNRISIFRGSQDDVLHRAIEAAKQYNYSSFLRICGDRPFIDPALCDEAVKTHNNNKSDITTNTFPRTVPYGLSAEVINIKSLKMIYKLTLDDDSREHISKFFYSNSDNFIIKSINHDNKFLNNKNVRLVLDTKNDLQKVIWIDKNIHSDRFDINKIITLAIKWEKKNAIINK